jgi:hypothetical protein
LAEIFVPADFSSETAAHFVAHLLPEFGAARGTIPFANVMAIEHVEILEDRICIARHRQDAQQFGLAGRPHSLAMSATVSGWPMAEPRSSRSFFSSRPVI